MKSCWSFNQFSIIFNHFFFNLKHFPEAVRNGAPGFARKFFKNDFGVGCDQRFLIFFSIFHLWNFDQLGNTLFLRELFFSIFSKTNNWQCCFSGCPNFFLKEKYAFIADRTHFTVETSKHMSRYFDVFLKENFSEVFK